MNMKTRSVATAIALLAAGALLTGCGANSGTPAPPPVPATQGAHNQADIVFAQQMIPHHAQAVRMSELAAEHASSPQVKELANRIEAAQQPEIDQMTAMLREWNAPVPHSHDSGMAGMDHGGDMPGMMSDHQMHQLGQAHGTQFDQMFLRMMIEHHQGAISMAQTELRDGQNPQARQLAQNIAETQQREIDEMRVLLSG